jgi:hypothetical protein
MATKTPAGFYIVPRPRLELAPLTAYVDHHPPVCLTAAAPVTVSGGWVTTEHAELLYLVWKGFVRMAGRCAVVSRELGEHGMNGALPLDGPDFTPLTFCKIWENPVTSTC